jgi:hypothetical protein
MNTRALPLVAGAALLAALIAPPSARAQLVLGQYEDEAPLGSWNTLGIAIGPSLACGGARIAAAWDASAALSNPALIAGLPRLTFTLSGSFLSASLRKYSILNTGVLGTSSNLPQDVYALEFAGVSYRTGGWTFAAASAVTESYARPGLEFQTSEEGVPVYSIESHQTGWMKVLNLSAARRVSRRWAVGLGLNAVFGKIDRDLTEEFLTEGIAISDRRTQKLLGFYADAGLTWAASEKLSAALVFRTPSTVKSDSDSLLEYTVPSSGTDIRIAASASDRYRRPWVAGAGISWRPSGSLRIVSDLAFFNWSSYAATYFDEKKTRDFRNVCTFAAGFEYTSSYRLFGRNAVSPIRVGFRWDPQPMTTPRSAYSYVTFGTGLEMGRLRLDVSGAIGREGGSGDSLSAKRASVTLTYAIGD